MNAIICWRDLVAYNTETLFQIERELKAHGAISLAAYDVLSEIEIQKDKRIRMQDLAMGVILTKSGVTKMANSLVKQGFIRREKCPHDRRGTYAAITPKGSEAVKKAWPIYRACIRRFFSAKLAAAEIESLARFIAKLRAPQSSK
ncbi:MAG: MarR family transcriptional regulator [Spirochaetes bacterium]|nr:MarR family transcriptional regulator [Spirochaetota bacterium]